MPGEVVVAVLPALDVERDVVVEERVVLDHPAGAHLRAERRAAKAHVVAERDVEIVPLKVEVVIEGVRRIAVAALPVGLPAVVVGQNVLDQQLLRVLDVDAVGLGAIGNIQYLRVAQSDVVGPLDHGAAIAQDQVVQQDRGADAEDAAAPGELDALYDDVLGRFLEDAPIVPEHWPFALAPGADEDRMQRRLPLRTALDEAAGVFVFVAALEQEVVRGRVNEAARDRPPEIHRRILVEGHPLAAAVLGMRGQPLAVDLALAQAFAAGDVGGREGVAAARDVDLPVVLARLDHAQIVVVRGEGVIVARRPPGIDRAGHDTERHLYLARAGPAFDEHRELRLPALARIGQHHRHSARRRDRGVSARRVAADADRARTEIDLDDAPGHSLEPTARVGRYTHCPYPCSWRPVIPRRRHLHSTAGAAARLPPKATLQAAFTNPADSRPPANLFVLSKLDPVPGGHVAAALCPRQLGAPGSAGIDQPGLFAGGILPRSGQTNPAEAARQDSSSRKTRSP